jgi:hypothetical protein
MTPAPAIPLLSMTWPQYRRSECVHRGWRVRLMPREAELLLLLHEPAATSRLKVNPPLGHRPSLEFRRLPSCRSILPISAPTDAEASQT